MIRSIVFSPAVLAFSLVCLPAHAQYDMSTAVSLSPGSSSAGAMSTEHADYWWKVTIPQDGILEIETNSDAGMDIDLGVYDEHVNYLAGNAIGAGTVERSRLANAGAATYYIKAHRWIGEGSYTISSTFTPVALANDPERNDAAETAMILAPNGSDTGHLGYHDPDIESIDPDDWWQVTTTFDGALIVETHADSTIDIDLSIYDQDMNTYLAGNDIGTGPEERTQHFSLAEGTYFIKAHRWLGYGSYAITSTFEPTGLAIDTEVNDAVEDAIVLPANGEDTGHLGYYLNGETDVDDWWQVTTTFDGALIVETHADSTIDIDLSIYDQDMNTYIAGNSIGAGPEERTQHYSLAEGTYYIKAHRWLGYGSYTIVSTFEPTGLAIDTEVNDAVDDAIVLPANGEDTGHLGYFLNGERDINDWRIVTVPFDGALVVETHADSTVDIDLSIYDQDLTTYLAGNDIGAGPDERTHVYNLKAGTYYVKAHRWSGYGSYTMTSRYTPADFADDPEPNDSSETAVSLYADITVTGHLGYHALGETDIDDYYALTVPAGWDSLYVHSLSDSTLETDLALYDSEGSYVASAGAYGIHEILKYRVSGGGTYYVKAHRWTGYGSYALIAGSGLADPVVSGAGSIAGTVAHSIEDHMLAGVTVTLTPGPYTAATGESGMFEFADIPAGAYTITASMEGFDDTEMIVSLNAGGELEYALLLAPADVAVDAEPPLVFKVSPPYPNPFNPATVISFTLPERSVVRIVIYDMLGQTVRVLTDEYLPSGEHEVIWDGRNTAGMQAASGLYLYSLRAGVHTASGKMTLLR